MLCAGQVKIFPFSNATSTWKNGQLYVAGFTDGASTLKIIKLNARLEVTDSVEVKNARSVNNEYLRLMMDTLHDYLNIYIQKKGEATVDIIRANKNLKIVSQVNKVDVARLNNSAMLGNDAKFNGPFAYAIKQVRDTSGQQFYLNKYRLSDTLGNFDYQPEWQFAFERKFIYDAGILYAGPDYVLVFVNLVQPEKTSQWLLKIHSKTGKLVRGTKLNRKNDNFRYQPGKCIVDTVSHAVEIVGQKLSSGQTDVVKNIFSLANGKPVMLYYCKMDSLGEVLVHETFSVNASQATEGASKQLPGYAVNIAGLKKEKGFLVAEGDIYVTTPKKNCFRYVNTIPFSIKTDHETAEIKKTIIEVNRQIQDFSVSRDKTDMNGMLCIDSISEISKMYTSSPGLRVKLAFKTDEQGNSRWLLTRSNANKQNIVLAQLQPNGKVYSITTEGEFLKSSFPQFNSGGPVMISSSQLNDREYQLKLLPW